MSVMLCDCSIFIDLSMGPICVVCLIQFVNCLLNVFAICFAIATVFMLNISVCFLFEIPFIVFQSIGVLCLLSQCEFRCSFNIF